MTPATASNRFFFDGDATIADLKLVAVALERAGRTPSLRFVRYSDGEIEGVAVDIGGEESSRPTEMAVAGTDESLSDPRD